MNSFETSHLTKGIINDKAILFDVTYYNLPSQIITELKEHNINNVTNKTFYVELYLSTKYGLIYADDVAFSCSLNGYYELINFVMLELLNQNLIKTF